MRTTLLWLALITVAIWWWRQPPGAGRIIAGTYISIDHKQVEHDGLRYAADWGQRTVHRGDLRVISRAYHRAVPFITHEAVLTTGQFSDPEIVTVSPMRKGSMSWRAKVQPQGTLIVLHFIPADPSVLDSLKALNAGDRVILTGHEVVDQRIVADPRHSLRLNHNNHRFLLVTEAKLEFQ